MTEPGPAEQRRPIPTSPEEALAIARTEYEPLLPDGTPAPLHVQEFDIGYLVYAVFPVDPNPTFPPAEPGGNSLVISKSTGEISRVPNHPPEAAIALYREHYPAARR